jgi:chorismate lyase
LTKITNTDNLALQKDWYRLHLVWEGGEAEIQEGLPHSQLAPAWQLMLLGDGSPTRHLQLLTHQPTEVDVIDMSLIGMELDHAPAVIESIPGPRLRRQVWLKTASVERLAYACSWWEANHINEYLQNSSLPIWEN